MQGRSLPHGPRQEAKPLSASGLAQFTSRQRTTCKKHPRLWLRSFSLPISCPGAFAFFCLRVSQRGNFLGLPSSCPCPAPCLPQLLPHPPPPPPPAASLLLLLRCSPSPPGEGTMQRRAAREKPGGSPHGVLPPVPSCPSTGRRPRAGVMGLAALRRGRGIRGRLPVVPQPACRWSGRGRRGPPHTPRAGAAKAGRPARTASSFWVVQPRDPPRRGSGSSGSMDAARFTQAVKLIN